MTESGPVVVGIDFTPGCRSALRDAIRLARWSGAPVHAIHVIDTLVAAELEEALGRNQPDVRAAVVADARAAWPAFVGDVEGAAGVSFDVRIDHRIQGIVSAAGSLNAALLVLGARSTPRPDVGPGSIATGCVRYAPCSVLLSRDDRSGPFKVVAAPTDFSPTSRLALEQAARIAARDGAALHILHVFDPPWAHLHYRAPTAEADPHFQREYRAALERRLQAFAADLGLPSGAPAPVFSLITRSGHRSAIIDHAQQIHADLVVLGARGRTNLRDVLLGSTAERVLSESVCSVLVVRPRN